ncbi:DUF3685 domain-containing protein [Candidatus Synechococcus calcipolaris G9]|uniref:DUF3685 domain-containing protein n=1 Tax=Candidatus Synechococcus calcipolaris G9 TaxID=1497997 RepID=A0ABT6F3C8_9SYNE|nr:DUF3685 domain-containing protein [Candidatus Synechococcus calcipolaris]MDG2992376.1 DUF3685 domain-containing protein [Candidatus Synechococcus calcipolaris G9]
MADPSPPETIISSMDSSLDGPPAAEELFPGLRLLIADGDPVFRLGLEVGLNQVKTTDGQILTVVVGVADGNSVVQFLRTAPLGGDRPGVDIAVIDAQLTVNHEATPWLMQWLKQYYPQIRILLLVGPGGRSLLELATTLGIEGVYPKGTALEELIAGLQAIHDGEQVWLLPIPQPTVRQRYPNPITRWQYQFIQSGLEDMDTWLTALNRYLSQEQLHPWQRLVCEGRQREILVARWLVGQFLPPSRQPTQTLKTPSPPSPLVSNQTIPALIDRCLSRSQSDLLNLTGSVLEIDILTAEKRRELVYTVLREWEGILRALQITPPSREFLNQRRDRLLLDLWEQSTRAFFGPYTLIKDGQTEITPILLVEAPLVQRGLLEPIPLVPELFAHLLLQTPLHIDQKRYAYGSPETVPILDALVDHLILGVSNGVIQPLLNRLSHLEEIQSNFFDRRMLSSREIERFRNALSWKYRWFHLIGEPQDIFESRMALIYLSDRGIEKKYVALPRTQELQALEGMRLLVTLALETRDALSPPVRSAIAWVGQGMVYILTHVIGRGIGLIGRGIAQGVGQSFQGSLGSSTPSKKRRSQT